MSNFVSSGQIGPTGLSDRSDRLIRVFYFHLGPTTLKISHSLSQLTPLSLSRSLSLTLSLTSSLSLKPQTPNRPSQLDLRTKGASNPREGSSSPRAPSRGALDFKFFVQEKSRSRYSNLCRPNLPFQEVLSDFLWSITSICIPSLGSKGVLIFVGQFSRDKDFYFWLKTCLSELLTRCRNFLHVYFGQAEHPLTEENKNFRQLSELPTHLFWFGRAPLVGRNSKLPMGVGTSDTRSELPISTEQQSL